MRPRFERGLVEVSYVVCGDSLRLSIRMSRCEGEVTVTDGKMKNHYES